LKTPAQAGRHKATNGGIVSAGTKPALLPLQEQEAMQKRRFQNPKPEVHGNRWTVRVSRLIFKNGQWLSTRPRVDLGPATMTVREAQKEAAEVVRPLNQGMESLGSGVSFEHYVNTVYIPVELPLMSASTRDRYEGVLNNYLIPAFGTDLLRDMTTLKLQTYISGLAKSVLAHESKDKIRDVLSSVLASAVKYRSLIQNPAQALRLPPAEHGKKVKPHITEKQFNDLIEMMQEPYASMVFVSTLTGLRISELAGLRWNDVHEDSITIDERFCRGDWGRPKSNASNATIPALPQVIDRIQRLKTLKVRIGGGRGGHQTFKVVKSEAQDALVFQSVRKGAPLRDNNILSRHIEPTGKKLGMPWVNWRCLRTSFATLLKEKGVHVRDAQALMRHSRATTTIEIYQQTTDAHQRAAVNTLAGVAGSRMIN
jgi:integrase